MNEYIGSVVDTIIDKKGRHWPIIKLHDGIYGFRDCPFVSCYNEEYGFTPWEKSTAFNEAMKWIGENMTAEQQKRWDKPFIASLANIVGGGFGSGFSDIQWDYYKDWHNRVKSCPDYWGQEDADYGACYITSTLVDYEEEKGVYVQCVNTGGKPYVDRVLSPRGVSLCFMA